MRIFAISIALIFSFSVSAFSDVIHFKNGGKVEGLVVEVTEDGIVIDLGIGTMTARHDEIDYIEEASAEELEQLKKKKLGYEIRRGEWSPEGYEDIKIVYLRCRDDKDAITEAKKKKDFLESQISQKEKEASQLLGFADKKSKELNTISPEKDVIKYNEVATEINSINANLDKVNKNLKSLYEEEKEINNRFSKLANNYRTSYELLKNGLEAKQNNISEGNLTPDERYYFNEMDIKINEMGEDFKKDTASYTPKGDQLIVDALLNGKVTARLMVDTGASIVLLSAGVANRLGIEYDKIPQEIEIILADGTRSKAKPIILDSVEVGNAQVKNVQSAITDNKAVEDIDGLLGMSFLSHFIIKVDSNGNRLILERVLE